jgi:hypothetical protein
MNHFAHIPLARLIVPFTAGIIAYLSVRIHFSLFLFFSVYIILGLIWIFWRKFFLAHYARRWIFGTWAAAFLLTAGYQIAQNHHQLARKDHFSHLQEEGGFLLLKVREPVSEKANSYQVIAKREKAY